MVRPTRTIRPRRNETPWAIVTEPDQRSWTVRDYLTEFELVLAEWMDFRTAVSMPCSILHTQLTQVDDAREYILRTDEDYNTLGYTLNSVPTEMLVTLCHQSILRAIELDGSPMSRR